MKKDLLMLFLFSTMFCNAQLPLVSQGSTKRFANFSSKYVKERNVDVWLPANYNTSDKYNVIYMHDGQMLFDSSNTWNRQEWMVDETISKLINEGKISNCIVVGIWSIDKLRNSEYIPEKPVYELPDKVRDSLIKKELNNHPLSNNYLLFITTELKPFIDKTFSVYTDYTHTFIAGSGKGASISIYALCEYPEIFGGAACLSAHWMGNDLQLRGHYPEEFLEYLKQNLPAHNDHKIYFDYSSITTDSLYRPFQIQVDKLMKKKGYTDNNWMTKEFPDEPATESAWSKRFDIPLLFLLGKQ